MSFGFSLSPVCAAIGTAWTPMQLFSNSEQGVWYDVSDFSTLFQDSAGTTPVTAVEQPVGLMLDKSKGLVLGAELVVNGGPFTTTTGWGGTLASIAVVGGEIVATNTTAAAGSAAAAFATTIGKTYRVSAQCRKVTGSVYSAAQSVAPYITLAQNAVTSSTTLVVQTITFVATTTSSQIFFKTTSAVLGDSFAVGGLSVRELPGYHATQATAASRPILKQDGNGKYYLLFDGVDDSMATGSIDFTSTDKMTVFAGVRKLSDAAIGILCELSADSNTNNGSLFVAAPITVSGSNYSILSKGTIATSAAATGLAAPITNVVAGAFNISAPNLVTRVNGTQRNLSAATQGTGNYGNYPLYIGRRGGTSLPFNGHLYSLIARGAQSTDAQITSAETYVNSKTAAY